MSPINWSARRAFIIIIVCTKRLTYCGAGNCIIISIYAYVCVCVETVFQIKNGRVYNDNTFTAIIGYRAPLVRYNYTKVIKLPITSSRVVWQYNLVCDAPSILCIIIDVPRVTSHCDGKRRHNNDIITCYICNGLSDINEWRNNDNNFLLPPGSSAPRHLIRPPPLLGLSGWKYLKR